MKVANDMHDTGQIHHEIRSIINNMLTSERYRHKKNHKYLSGTWIMNMTYITQ
jgi:hypothetical protein